MTTSTRHPSLDSWGDFDRDDPFPLFAHVRSAAPVHEVRLADGHPAWLVVGHEEARAALNDPRMSKDMHAALARSGEVVAEGLPGPALARHMLAVDPPDHTRLRRLLAPTFSARRLQELVPRVHEAVAERLDALEKAGSPADLVEQFATPVPAMVIGDLLGVPRDEQEEFGALSANRFDLLQSMLAPLDSAAASIDYLLGLIARQRANPGGGLLARLIAEHADDVSDRELAGLADGLLVGGHETTASMLALGTLVLLQDPDRAAAVRDDGVDADRVVEELLRHLSVVQVAFPRFARHATRIGDQDVAEGDLVLCSLSGADRDPALGEGLEQVDLTRAPTPHLAFGYGMHHCLGAPLARIELRIALPALLRRFPTLRVAAEPGTLRWKERSIVYGLDALPVAW
jgi:cytochrome P450